MAAPALDVGITYARLWAQDTSTTSPGLTDAQYTILINDAYMRWYKNIEQRVARVASFMTLADGTLEGVSTGTDPEILGLEINLTPLERMEYAELRALRAKDSTTGTPTAYALHKDTATEKWLCSFWRIPNGAFTVTALTRIYPTALSGTAVPVLGDAEGYWLYRIAAAEACYLLRRPEEHIERILRPVPEDIRRKMGVEFRRAQPRPRPSEVPVG